MNGFKFYFKIFINQLQKNGYQMTIKKIINHILKEINSFKNKRENIFFPQFNHNPLVSIVVVNFNGSDYIEKFIKAIGAQTYKNFELILVDNLSEDSSIEILEKIKPEFRYKIIRNNSNIGFAEGCNIGADVSKGELIALINIDTIPDVCWLKTLVDGLRFDSKAAAATSKTLFYEDFFDITINCKDRFIFNLEEFEKNLDYPKYFIRSKHIKNDDKIECDGFITISVPVSTKKIKLKVCVPDFIGKEILVLIEGKIVYQSELRKPEETLIFNVPIIINPTAIINNAGSNTRDDDNPYDIGFGEYDCGQYDIPKYVTRFCGCSVLIRRLAISRRKLFISEFFAYYEDSELSRYLIESGFKIIYRSNSIVRHYHSATSDEKSLFRRYLIQRNREIYKSMSCSENEKNDKIKNLFLEYANSIPDGLKTLFTSYDQSIGQVFDGEISKLYKKKSIAVYNSYWNTFGGGESHALYIAKEFINNDTNIFLLSENDFNVDKLFEYFGIEQFEVIKYVGPVTENITKFFDVFINSTYNSNLISNAKQSYYVVSFPHRNLPKSLTENYVFLFNSHYTKRWAEDYWGKINGKIRLPVDSLYRLRKLKIPKKQKMIALIGRFCVRGHTKKQDLVLRSFLKAIEISGVSDWKLGLMGSLDMNDQEAVNFYNKIRDASYSNSNVMIIANASREKISELYINSSHIISATGTNEEQTSPELFEHFGIAFVEGIAYGCFPIAQRIGGPAEILHHLGIGELFSTEDELINVFLRIFAEPLPNPQEVHLNLFQYLSIINNEHRINELTN